MTFTTKGEMLALSDYSWQRTRKRLEGLTDDEYLWEPVPGGWSIRPRRDGAYRVETVRPAPVPPPFTTIAWRMHHLAGCYGQARNATLLRVDVPPGPDLATFPGTATDAIAVLTESHASWRSVLLGVDEAILWDKLGPAASEYSESSVASFVMHMLDEFIHHGAEIGVLRDLWRARERDAGADLRALRDDPAADPDVVLTAAQAGRWEVVVELAEAGFDVNRGTRTPLHLAAGAGDLDAVQALVEHGADTTARDPDFNSTPAEWAQYFHNPHVIAYLESLDTASA